LARADDDGVKKGLSSILNQVDKMSTTIRQLLDFARARPVEVEAVSAAHALGQAAALLEHRFRQANVALSVQVAPSLPSLAADRGQLEQVLVNLLINACDACAKGGAVVARAHAGDGDNEIVLEIADDGCGIPPEQLAAVFDPFFTTKKRGQGTGLGLSIAADIVKNHGGRLILDSQVGTGTVARIFWPQAQS
jgi:signal transduction histidine kinase